MKRITSAICSLSSFLLTRRELCGYISTNLKELLHPPREEQAGSMCLLLDEDVFHPPRASGHSIENWAAPPRFPRASVLLKRRSGSDVAV